MSALLTEQSNGLSKGWERVKLGDICHVVRGSSPRPKGDPRYYGPGVPRLMVEDCTRDGMFVTPRVDFLTELGATLSRPMKAGDVVMVVSGNPGLPAILEVDCCIHDGFVGFRDVDSERVHNSYLYYFLKLTKAQTDAHATGAIFRNLTTTQIRAIDVVLPPLAEQKRIAAILKEQLAAVERARAAAEAQLETAKALPPAYLRDVFSTDHIATWPCLPLGEVCRIVAKQVDPTLPEYRDLPHINGENIESGTCRLLWLNTAAEDGMTSGKYLFEEGNILYSKLRPYLRKVVLAPCRGVCSADMYPVEVDSAVLNSEFAAWMLLSDDFTNYADEESRRARMPKLNREQLFAWPAPLPKLDEQEMIIARLRQQMKSAGNLETILRQQVKDIAAMPASLLRAAFQGRL